MKQFSSLSEMAAFAAQCRASGTPLALVPTMGSLHAGKQALIRAAAAESGAAAVVSMFVNPLQFGPNEPIARYPRNLDADLTVCQECGAAAVFVPSSDAMLPPGFGTHVTEEVLSKPCAGHPAPAIFGESRP